MKYQLTESQIVEIKLNNYIYTLPICTLQGGATYSVP